MNHYKMRPGTSADAEVVREIFFAALSEHGFAPIEANLNHDIATFGAGAPTRDELVATVDDEVVGFIILAPTRAEGVGELSKLFVARPHRQAGVATLLMSRAMKIAKRRGYRSLVLYTNDAFATARAYYERRGWSRVAADDTTAVYTRAVAEPSFVLRWVLSLLQYFARVRSRLEDELDPDAARGIEPGRARAGPPPRRARHER